MNAAYNGIQEENKNTKSIYFFCVVLLGIEQMQARHFSKEISGFKQLF